MCTVDPQNFRICNLIFEVKTKSINTTITKMQKGSASMTFEFPLRAPRSGDISFKICNSELWGLLKYQQS